MRRPRSTARLAARCSLMSMPVCTDSPPSYSALAPYFCSRYLRTSSVKNGATDRGGCGCPRVTIGFCFDFVGLLLRDVAVVGHLLKRVIAAELRGRSIDIRALTSGRLDDAGDHRRFFERHVLRALAEVEARRGFDAVGAVAEMRLIGVEGENLALRVALLDLDRDEDFLDLALGTLIADDESDLFGETARGRAASSACCRPPRGAAGVCRS